MKKLIFTFLLAIGTSMAINAEVVIQKFYGTQANNSYKNPCKGETIRVCGEIRNELRVISLMTHVKEVSKDMQGIVTNTNSYVTSKTPGTIINEIIKFAPANSAVFVNPSDNEEIED